VVLQRTIDVEGHRDVIKEHSAEGAGEQLAATICLAALKAVGFSPKGEKGQETVKK
jgi:hypothetical protein